MNGNVTLNGISDANLIFILQTKEKFPRELTFQPEKLQPSRANPQAPQVYSAASLTFTGPEGLEGVIDILKHIHGKQAV